jgi:hypothetical protein
MSQDSLNSTKEEKENQLFTITQSVVDADLSLLWEELGGAGIVTMGLMATVESDSGDP